MLGFIGPVFVPKALFSEQKLAGLFSYQNITLDPSQPHLQKVGSGQKRG